MLIIKVVNVLVASVVLLNVTACCKKSCSDASIAAQVEVEQSVDKSKTSINQEQKTVVNFAYNSAELSNKDVESLSAQISALLENKNLRLQIDGHTDERGSDSYNLALGERRAKAVAVVLESQGVSSDRIIITSYGKKKPLVHELNEGANAQNRRAELKYINLP